MKRILLGVALSLMAHAAFAAIQYEFFQISHSDSDSTAASDFNGRAVIDGTRSRVDFLSGNAYPPGTYVISTDGARKLLFVDPTQKSFTEVNALGIASAIGTSNIKITNLQKSVTKLEDHPQVAGIPTDHYRLSITYEISVTFRTMPLTQRVTTVIDKWTTVLFGDAADAAFTGSTLATGNPQIDEIIGSETSNIKGFPLKQAIKVTTVNLKGGPTPGSKLNIPVSRTRTREMTVTAISQVPTDEKVFTVPAGYKKSEFDEQVNKTQMQVLSMEPARD